ncbi:MAG: ORF6N domain-containing protein [Calditrichaeota bacterium]|nr:ORF6N domain-containing protein [Calditrichota bacterium]
MREQKSLMPIERIEQLIFHIRNQKVMLDSDIARIYGVTTKRLNEQIRRNKDRFPSDFMFQLTKQEVTNLKSQIATSSGSVGWGGRRKPPNAFTEHGAVMIASVLNTPIAVQASIQVVRAFIQLRRMLASYDELSQRLDELEGKYDEQFGLVFKAIRELMKPPDPKHRKMGFRIEDSEEE